MPIGSLRALHRPALISWLVPMFVIALAGIAARTPIAEAHPRLAVLLLLWIVADSLTLALITRSPERPPSVQKVVGTLAVAALSVGCMVPPSLRAALLDMPVVVVAMLGVVALHLGWGIARGRRMLRAPATPGRNKWIAAASELLPPMLVRLAAAELSLLHLALFRWGGPADVPAGARAFGYHRHLTPIFIVMLALQLIEIAVMHLLVGFWSPTAALILFVISDVALVYLVGLIKSFRIKPVLITAEGVRLRTGILIDRMIPYDMIESIDTGFAGALVKDRATLNAALIAWPNLMVRLREPIPRETLLFRHRPITAIVFRLDDPEDFVRVLRWRLGPPSDR